MFWGALLLEGRVDFSVSGGARDCTFSAMGCTCSNGIPDESK